MYTYVYIKRGRKYIKVARVIVTADVYYIYKKNYT